MSFALAGALMIVLGLTQRFATLTAVQTFDRGGSGRATGLAFVLLAWMLLVSARYTATGLRRLAGRALALGLALAGAVRLAGERALADADALLPFRDVEGARALTAGAVLLVLAAWAHLTSPARRR